MVNNDVDNHALAVLYQSGVSIPQIAKRVERSFCYVRGRLIKAGVKFRTNSEAVHLAKRARPVEPNELLLEIVDGLLLGDGSIQKGDVGSRLILVQTITHLGWVEDVQQQLEGFGLEFGVVNWKAGMTQINGKRYRRRAAKGFRSRCYSLLTRERERWYPNGTKRIPRDVRLSPTSLAHWYFGDGGTGCNGYHARFCTDDFPKEDVDFLMTKLQEVFGWAPIREQRNRILLCKMADRASLVAMIAGKTPECFRYKLALRTESRSLLASPEKHRELARQRQDGTSYRELAKRFGVSKSAAWWRLNRARALDTARCSNAGMLALKL